MGLERSIFIRLIRHFGKITGNRFSFTNTAQALEIDVKTVQRYLYTLGYNFLGTLLPFLDKNKLDVKDKKMKKFYFIDPFIYEVLHRKTGIKVEPSILAECVVLKELLDYATGIEEGLANILDLGYWYSDKGKEVDFIAERMPIESKFKTRVKEPDKASILKHFKEGVILSKDEIDFSGAVKVIPIHLFLALISPSRNRELL
jgi:predicted AAA+ superfamily ATPase